jgi:hypothetical protein
VPYRVWAIVERSAEGDEVMCRALLRSIVYREAHKRNICLPEDWDVTDIEWDPNHFEAFIRDRVAVAGTVCGASRQD